MRIQYSASEISRIVSGTRTGPGDPMVNFITYDTRRVIAGENAIFLCLKSENRNGHKYIESAYEKGVRVFLVDEKVNFETFQDAVFIEVIDVMTALQIWASHHRQAFSIPVIGITGSAGKTIVKEWLYSYLAAYRNVARSPKSYNSQLGVAISLFEINEQTEIALIEAGISQPKEMALLAKMIQPTIGLFTSLGENHLENFASKQELLREKLVLFQNCPQVFTSQLISESDLSHSRVDTVSPIGDPQLSLVERMNIALCEAVSSYLGLDKIALLETRKSLPKLSLRLETTIGLNKSKLVLDAFNWTLDGLEQALSYQASIAEKSVRILIIHQSDFEKISEHQLNRLLNRFNLHEMGEILVRFKVYASEKVDFIPREGQNILLKGSHPEILRLGLDWRERKHQTYVELSLHNLARNLKVWSDQLPKETKVLAMVKASSYGTEIGQLGLFLSQQNIQYIGVAYVDEGVELRKMGIRLPIMVMNSDSSGWNDCLHYEIEPSIYSVHQLEELNKTLSAHGTFSFPIHLKLDTGMHRLGFMKNEMDELKQALQKMHHAIQVKSVFSHLADADNPNDDFTLQQVALYDEMTQDLETHLGYSFMRHLMNSEGSAKTKLPKYDMVRIGIGLYGNTSQAEMQQKLSPVLSWKSVVSQVKTIQKGESIGYGRTFVAEKETRYAVVPVGYADGFSRILSQGKGGVYIHNHYCPTLGNVCMDMIMVEVPSELTVLPGDNVEIIGSNQNIETLAKNAATIPYEIMTGLSQRMPRIFIQGED